MNPLRILGGLLGGAVRTGGDTVTTVGTVVKDAGEVVQGTGGAVAAAPSVFTAALPPAEPGSSTTEWKGSLITKALIIGFGVAAAIGHGIPAGAQAPILAAVGPALALEQSAYALSRAWRKAGTG